MPEPGSEQPPLRVAVLGAYGRMGAVVCRGIEASADLQLVAALGRDDPRDRAEAASVVVDFTHPGAVMGNARWALERGKHLVIGTTGFDEDRLSTLQAWVTARAPGPGVFVVPNFSLSALLATRFAAMAAPYYPSVEILDLSHEKKAEAPSGTAIELARAVARARAVAGGSPAAADPSEATGALVEGIPVHSVRMRGLVLHETVLFSTEGEVLRVRFDAHDRSAYVPGVLRAVRAVVDAPGLHVGLGSLYDLEDG
ncbi:4-hydroxy-tetrahydrodipicolinate reductase [Micromonospora carbonacea]|uniref:4-hydroxy-tetrahydrodipicolinate reductase n=1 Tax=Micromonospora carbonacea TaxID=47853 RepID=A0A1C5AUF1_9ACTN|nr:4-hydroxy-tetrahydrodipicolinate reductase [Micromonospora carbonacea]SCF48681.1 dihydrodipicolinate reductase [Micromonospora carbonacea]